MQKISVNVTSVNGCIRAYTNPSDNDNDKDKEKDMKKKG